MTRVVDGLNRDQRRPPFCYQTSDALTVLREVFAGAKRATALAIYLTLTDVANTNWDDGGRNGFKAARAEIAELAGVSVDTFDRYVKEFETVGLLHIERRTIGKVSLPNEWSLRDPPSRTHAATPAAPVRHIRARDKAELQEVVQDLEPTPPVGPPQRPDNRPAQVNRKPVKDHEYETATQVLTAFNHIAGTRYQSSDWIAKVISRCREHPDLTPEQHEAVIRRAFADPWWTGPPSPSIVYGNAAVFEQSIHALTVGGAPGRERGLTTEEMRGMGVWWGDGTPHETPDDAYRAGVPTPVPTGDVVDDAEWAEITEQPALGE